MDISRIIYINSRNRIGGTESDFIYDLGINASNYEKYDRCCLLTCTIPKSYYLVSDYNNYFYLSETGHALTQITLTNGNYNRSTFKTALTTALNAQSTTNGNNYVYAISFVTGNNMGVDKGHFTFTVTGNSGDQPIFTFTDNGLFEIMGFDKNSTNAFIASSLESVNVMNFNIENSLFLHCDSIQNESNNILQNIVTTDSTDFSYINFTQSDIELNSKPFLGSNSTSCRFYLTNEENNFSNLMDTNGLNIVFSILLYKQKENIDKIIKDYIYYKLI